MRKKSAKTCRGEKGNWAKKCKIAPPGHEKKVKKNLFLAARIAPEKVIHVGESENTKLDMKLHYGDMKL